MLDFETLGTSPSSVVVSLGAVAFNRRGVRGKRYIVFDLPTQIKAGRAIDAGTLTWWMNQSDEARKVFVDHDEKVSVREGLLGLNAFFVKMLEAEGEDMGELRVWGNGANFDVSLLEDLFRSEEGNVFPKPLPAIPWKYWNVWCYRTFNALTKCGELHTRPNGTHHHALHDAEFQARCVLAYYAKQDAKRKAK